MKKITYEKMARMLGYEYYSDSDAWQRGAIIEEVNTFIRNLSDSEIVTTHNGNIMYNVTGFNDKGERLAFVVVDKFDKAGNWLERCFYE